jgi:hypothetical protein
VKATTLYRAAGLDELESSVPAEGKQKAPTGVIKARDDHRIEPRLPSAFSKIASESWQVIERF